MEGGPVTFVYPIAHLIGVRVFKAVKVLFPNAEFPASMLDASGFLFILTAFLILVQAAKKDRLDNFRDHLATPGSLDPIGLVQLIQDLAQRT